MIAEIILKDFKRINLFRQNFREWFFHKCAHFPGRSFPVPAEKRKVFLPLINREPQTASPMAHRRPFLFIFKVRTKLFPLDLTRHFARCLQIINCGCKVRDRTRHSSEPLLAGISELLVEPMKILTGCLPGHGARGEVMSGDRKRAEF